MPYFKRKPYAETLRDAEAAVEPLVRPTQEHGKSILALASAVLAEETNSGSEVEGPFRVGRPIGPGETGKMTLCYADALARGAINLNLTCAGLATASGDRISAENVRIEPERLRIPPGGSEDVNVTILAPGDANDGLYSGKVISSGDMVTVSEIECEIRRHEAVS